jgi:hypothetical protein
MKNIHVLPTDKPSRLIKSINKGNLYLSKLVVCGSKWTNQNIYITNDAEIKEGDYSFYPPFGVGKNIFIDGELCFHIESKDGKGSFTQKTYQTLDRNKKIILTTDQSLDGVQTIDDDFLKWFIKNPNCEFVEVINWFDTSHTDLGYGSKVYHNNPNMPLYKITIPKEEPKQDDLVYFTKGKKYIQQDGVVILAGEKETDGMVIADPKKTRSIGHYSKDWNPKAFKILEEPKQETLEEVAENYRLSKKGFVTKYDCKKGFIEGAKWQQEQIGKSEFLQKLRATKSDAEARRLILETFKNK